MQTTLHRHKHNSHAYKSVKKAVLRPLTRMNKNVSAYVHKKPYQSLGLAALVVGVVVGLIYAKFK